MLQRSGAMPWRQVTAIARGVCNALAQLHVGNLVHGDLQPQSIYVTKRGESFDIGIAKIVGSAPNAGARLDYQAPELVLGAATPACDIYSLGVVMFEMIAGSWPAPGGAPPAMYLQRAAIPAELGQIVMRCMSASPQARFSNVRELAGTLDRLLGGSRDAAAGAAPRVQAGGAAHVANAALGPPIGVRRWGVAHEQLSHPDPNYTDHSLPKYVAKIAGTPQPNAAAQPAPAEAAARSSKRYLWLALIGLAGVVVGVVAVLVGG